MVKSAGLFQRKKKDAILKEFGLKMLKWPVLEMSELSLVRCVIRSQGHGGSKGKKDYNSMTVLASSSPNHPVVKAFISGMEPTGLNPSSAHFREGN